MLRLTFTPAGMDLFDAARSTSLLPVSGLSSLPYDVMIYLGQSRLSADHQVS